MVSEDRLKVGRVCDRCIRKKVKCDLIRPRCSRCAEVGEACIYSAERRKPGPSRGTKRRRLDSVPRAPTCLDITTPVSSATQQLSSPPDLSDPCRIKQGDLFSISDAAFPDPSPSRNTVGLENYGLSPDQEREILMYYFDEIHSGLPLFHQSVFLDLYGRGLVDHRLIVTIAAITARLLGPISYWGLGDIDSTLQSLLKSSATSDVTPGENTLDHMRAQCLLAFYEFHQYPGASAWMRISKLVRTAHALGLNQIENPELCSVFDADVATEEFVEDWRLVWWVIYCLDSYCNISSGAPFMIDGESINTTLVRQPIDIASRSPMNSLQKVFLADEVGDLWKTAQEIITRGQVVGYNLHLVTTAILRHAGYILRLRIEKGAKRIQSRTEVLVSFLSNFRLALPPRYLNPIRQSLNGESKTEHRARLTNILHLHMANLVVLLPTDYDEDTVLFKEKWVQSCENALGITKVVRQWDPQFSSQTDPAICFIVFTALQFVNTYRRSTGDEERSRDLEESETALLLFLKQFGTMWALPLKLAQLFEDSRNSNNEPLTLAQIDSLLRRIKSPLHPKFKATKAATINLFLPEQVESRSLELLDPCLDHGFAALESDDLLMFGSWTQF